eukprot:gene10718-49558_t
MRLDAVGICVVGDGAGRPKLVAGAGSTLRLARRAEAQAAELADAIDVAGT